MLYYNNKIRVNADLLSLTTEKANGVLRDYLVNEINNKNNYIFYFAGLIQDLLKPIISVNAKYKYGFREVRIEIAFFYLDHLFLVKTIKDNTKLDKEALKLDAIIDDIKSKNHNLKIVGYLLVNNKEKFLHTFKEVKKILNNEFYLLSEKVITNKQIKEINKICLS